jgi:hypothetical protein
MLAISSCRMARPSLSRGKGRSGEWAKVLAPVSLASTYPGRTQNERAIFKTAEVLPQERIRCPDHA